MSRNKKQKTKNKKQNSRFGFWILNIGHWVLGLLIITVFNYASCKYSFKDSAPIPPEVKTFRVNQFGNQAPYADPQLAPQLTEAMKQKVISNTRLRQTNEDDAQYDISGYVSNYAVTTTGISGSTASQNRLTITFHVIFKDAVDNTKNSESDVSSSFDYSANTSLTDAAQALNTQIITNLTDQIYNKIFSDW
ncbi:MAG TPA: LptE family protein [Ferruginibacter sp.]|nr:LptE family protein [Ferruginibacter sp.]